MPNTQTNTTMESARTQETALSNPCQLISTLLTSLFPSPSSPHNQQGNPLKSLPQPAKNNFLTLYALFETTLLPALDCLDRKLVTRLILPGGNGSSHQQELYLVRSAQQHHTSRQRGRSENENFYEVRLEGWNCSCPAFCFSAFPPASNSENSSSQSNEGIWEKNHATPPPPPSRPDLFGGMTRGGSIPAVCKHILACVLVRDCAGFNGLVEERVVEREEFAGWAAGWGD